METPLSLISGEERHLPVQAVSDYLETTHWPQELGGSIENLLIKQAAHTVKEIQQLLVSDGLRIEQLTCIAEKLLQTL